MDIDELGVIDAVAGTFETDRGAAGGEDVLEPVGVRPIGQRNDEPVVGRRCDDGVSARRPLVRPTCSTTAVGEPAVPLNGARAASSPVRCVERR